MSQAAYSGDSTAHSHGTEVTALLAVSGVVASGGALSTVLNRVAKEAAKVAGARSAAILVPKRMSKSNGGFVFRVDGAFRLGRPYRSIVNKPTPLALRTKGVPTMAMEARRPLVVEDTERDPRYKPWRAVAREEGYRAVASVPLIAGPNVLGVLDVHRERAGPWPEREQELLASFADHAASAIRATRLIEQQRRQVAALSRLVLALRGQTHEFANRVHAISGLLALGDYPEAQRFVADLESAQHETYRAVAERIGNSTLAGLIFAEITIAAQRGIKLSLGNRTVLDELPANLGESEAVTIIGNLLQNAFDAVADMPVPRRKVELTLRRTKRSTIIRVRDWGAGISSEIRDRAFKRGTSTKPEHAGMGLALVRETVFYALGRVEVRELAPGTAFIVTFDHV